MSQSIESMTQFRFVDLFAGLGGFHEALKGIGGKGVFAVEWVAELRDLYELNFGIRPYGDINNLNPNDVPDHDLLTAGFPCQPFSKAGEQLGFEHSEQGHLFFAVRDVLETKRPEMFILENVPNLLAHNQGKTWKRMSQELTALGYDIAHTRLSPHSFGVPQQRERLYVVGRKRSLGTFKWPEKSGILPDIRTVLDVMPQEARSLSDTQNHAFDAWQSFLKACPPDVALPSHPLWAMEWGASYPYETLTPSGHLRQNGQRSLDDFGGSFGSQLRAARGIEQFALLPSHARTHESRFPEWKIKFIAQNRRFYASNRSWIDPWIHKIWNLPSSFQKFEWNAQGHQRDLTTVVLQFRASGLRAKRPTTAPALVAMTDSQVPILGWERRYMTSRECAKLQSLEGLILPQQRTSAYKALGNAVNATVARLIAEQLILGTSEQISSAETKHDVDAVVSRGSLIAS